MGYVGKPNGKRQVFRRGSWFWVEGMAGDALDAALGKCEDFKSEKTALQHEVESRGRILIMSPKCHPGLAGGHSTWGKFKLEFRRHINEQNPENLRDNMLTALDTEKVLDNASVRRFAGRGREYIGVYLNLFEHGEEEFRKKGVDGFMLIEKMVKTAKTATSSTWR